MYIGLCSGHGNSVVIRELSLYPQSLLAKLTVCDNDHVEVPTNGITCRISHTEMVDYQYEFTQMREAVLNPF